MLNFIEVCSGAGGLSSGLIKAGFTPLLLNDFDSKCCKTLSLNHPNANIKCCKMDELEVDEYIGKVDLLTGGVPCQSFSLAGKRNGLDDNRGKLMFSFIDMIKKLKPKVFLIENVAGLLSHNGGETLNLIIDGLNVDGEYKISYDVLNSFDYGVPQKRKRIFIVGVLNTIEKEFTFPLKVANRKVLRDVLVNVPDSPCAKYSKKKKELFQLIPAGGCWVNLPIEKQKEYLRASYYSGGGKRGILRKLSMDEPCLTLLCSPSQKQTERCHPTENRPLSIREYARIQTFDDNYQFFGSITSQYKQIGNAVPVELAKLIGIQISLVLGE